MIWLAVTALLAVALAPVAWSVWHARQARGRREAGLALHRAQLVELERDLDERRIGPDDFKAATLEVQRRLLATAASEDAVAAPARSIASRVAIAALLLIVPAGSVGLYLVDGRPDLAVPPTQRPTRDAAEEAKLIEQLRAVIAQMDPKSEQAFQGNTLLAGAEEARGDDEAAAAAWRGALAVHFNPEIAARAAEALTRAAGAVTPEAAQLYGKALAAAPPDAPWRPLVEQRLQSAK